MQSKTEQFGSYKLIKKIAAGGMAEVFLAIHESQPEKLLALKRILPDFSDNTDFISLFQKEAYIAKQLKHPAIVAVYDHGVERHQLYLSMEYIEGRSLADILRLLQTKKEDLPIELIIAIASQVSAALDYAHNAVDTKTGEPLHIVHSDLSPHNIMMGYDGRLKIIDFGIARLKSHSDTDRSGKIQGKVGYLSPEQIKRQNIDARTDVFALGILLWEIVTGQSLFLEGSTQLTIENILEKQAPALRGKLPLDYQPLDEIINKCLRKEPTERYATMKELRQDLTNRIRPPAPDRIKLFLQKHFSYEIENLHLYNRSLLEAAEKPQLAKSSATSPSQHDLRLDDPMVTSSARRTSGFSNRDNLKNNLLNIFFMVLLSSGLVFLGGAFFFPKQMADLKKALSRKSLIEEYRLQIESRPTGAEIFVNGQPTGQVTPAVVLLKSPNPVTINLKKNGFQDYLWNPVNPVTSQNHVLFAGLQKTQPAFINFTSARYKSLNLIVDGTLYEDIELPLNKFSVDPGKEITIEAYTSSSRVRFKRSVLLKSGENRVLTLNF